MNRHGWLTPVTGLNYTHHGWGWMSSVTIFYLGPIKMTVIRDGGQPHTDDFLHQWPLVCDGTPRRHIWGFPPIIDKLSRARGTWCWCRGCPRTSWCSRWSWWMSRIRVVGSWHTDLPEAWSDYGRETDLDPKVATSSEGICLTIGGCVHVLSGRLHEGGVVVEDPTEWFEAISREETLE